MQTGSKQIKDFKLYYNNNAETIFMVVKIQFVLTESGLHVVIVRFIYLFVGSSKRSDFFLTRQTNDLQKK